MSSLATAGLSVIVVHPQFGACERDRCEYGDDHNEDHRQRRGIAHSQEAESLLIEIEGVEQRAVDRAARSVTDDECWGKRFERVDGLYDHIEENNRSQQGQRDLEELSDLARAIDACRFVHVSR